MATKEEQQKKLAASIRRLLTNCIGFAGDTLSETRKQAYDYYFQRLRGDEIAGRSQIVTGDLSSMVEGNLAQCIEPLTGKRLAEFCSYDDADEEQAQLESDCVHDMLFKKQNGFIEVTSAIKDAFLVRNGIIKVYVDERTHKKTVRKNNVHPAVITDVLAQIGDVAIHKYDPETGELSATVTKTTRKFRVESIAPENFLVPKDWHRQDLEGISFCAERHVEARSTLIERGFPAEKVNKLRRHNAPYNGASDSRLPRNVSPMAQHADKSQETVEWYECYMQLDDGTGAAELHRVCIADTTILDDDEADSICYATGVCIINPHTFIGISLHDKLKGVQDTTTAQTRALMDNLNATNKNRTAHLDEVVEADDLTDGRVNGSIRVKPGLVQDVRQAIVTMPIHDTSANILANLEHMRRVRGELGGAAVDMASGEMQLNERIGSQGVDRAYSAREAFAQFMTQILANTLIRSMYLIAHETLRTQWTGPIRFKRGKKWIVTEPNKWKVRDSVEMNLGKSRGERARIAAVLFAAMEKQAGLAAAGMEDILVDAENYYNAVMDWLRINDVPVPERYFLDPRSDRAKAAFKRKAEEQAAAAKKKDAMVQQAIALEQVRVALEKYKTDAQLQYQYWSDVIKAQIEEAKLTASAVIDWFKAKATAATAFVKGKPNESGSKETRASTSKQSDTSGSAGEA
jgi:hypothetical protein